MLTVCGAIVGSKPSLLQKAKPITFHFSLVIIVLLYAFVGGLVFHSLESEEYARVRQTDKASKRECVLFILLNTSPDALHPSANTTSHRIVDCWEEEHDMRTEWSYVTATLYGFGIVTTLGTIKGDETIRALSKLQDTIGSARSRRPVACFALCTACVEYRWR